MSQVKLLIDLKALRREAKISRMEVERLSGIADSNLQRMERGMTPNMETALKMAKFLELNVEDIWGLEDESDV